MKVSTNEAILLNMFIAVFIQCKQSLMNEFSDAIGPYTNRSWEDFAYILGHDPRVGRPVTSTTNFDSIINSFIRMSVRNRTQSSTVAGAITSKYLMAK